MSPTTFRVRVRPAGLSIRPSSAAMDAALERTAALLACVPGGLLPARTLAALTGWSARRLSRVCAAVDAAGGASGLRWWWRG